MGQMKKEIYRHSESRFTWETYFPSDKRVPIMPAAVKAPKRKTTHPEPEEDSFAEGIIKGLQDFKEGRMTRFKDAEELADYLRNL